MGGVELNEASCSPSDTEPGKKKKGMLSGIPAFLEAPAVQYGFWRQAAIVLIKSIAVENEFGRRLSANQAFVYMLFRLLVFAAIALALTAVALALTVHWRWPFW